MRLFLYIQRQEGLTLHRCGEPMKALPAQKSSFQIQNKVGDIMTRLSTGLAATCQLKHEGLVEMKELFTRAPWERDLKESAASRGTGAAGCVLARCGTTRILVPHPSWQPAVPGKETRRWKRTRRAGIPPFSGSRTPAAAISSSSPRHRAALFTRASFLPEFPPLPSPSRSQRSLTEAAGFPVVLGQECPQHWSCLVPWDVNAPTVPAAPSLAADNTGTLTQPGHEELLSLKIFAESSSSVSQHPRCFRLKAGYQKPGVFVMLPVPGMLAQHSLWPKRCLCITT
nr:uncharacterized protein LOC110355851 [Columba livia]